MSQDQPGHSFLRSFLKPTLHSSLDRRIEELDERIRKAGLSLNDKIEVFRQLSPKADMTMAREELRMERLLLSIPLESLATFKFTLEYDGDYKDIAEYLFHDIDDRERRGRILEHLRKAPMRIGIKVLTDVDDTMIANLIDDRYPKKTLYPGVLDFYHSLHSEPFDSPATPVTTLSARPNPIAGVFEESSLEGLRRLTNLTNRRLLPSALSGDLISGATGSLQTWLRANAHLLRGRLPHDAEDKIGKVKFENFAAFSGVYPEYRYVFVGDSGQADALTAQLMLTESSPEGTARVITTFIHDLRQFPGDEASLSSTFKNLPSALVIDQRSTSGRGVIVFRNYIAAAVIACSHAASLDNLVTASDLADITRSALMEFLKIPFGGREASRAGLRQQYREDAEEALALLTARTPGEAAPEAAVRDIRLLLDEHFAATRSAS